MSRLPEGAKMLPVVTMARTVSGWRVFTTVRVYESITSASLTDFQAKLADASKDAEGDVRITFDTEQEYDITVVSCEVQWSRKATKEEVAEQRERERLLREQSSEFVTERLRAQLRQDPKLRAAARQLLAELEER